MVSHSGAWTVVSIVRARIGRHVEKQSSEEGAKAQLTVCTASLHAHRLLGSGSQRQVDVVSHQAFKTQGDLRYAPPTRPQPEAQSSRSRRTPPATWAPPSSRGRRGPLSTLPFVLAPVNHLPHQCTISLIIGNHDYNAKDTLRSRRLHSCRQFSVT